MNRNIVFLSKIIKLIFNIFLGILVLIMGIRISISEAPILIKMLCGSLFLVLGIYFIWNSKK